MAKNKQAKRAIAMAMAATLTMGATFTALAETITNPDGSTTSTEVTPVPESGSGTQEDPTTSGTVTATITVHTDGTSQEVTETETNTSWEEVTEESETTFEGKDKETITVDKDENGNPVQEETITESDSEQVTITEDDGNEEGQVEVEVKLDLGEKVTVEGVSKDETVGDSDKSDGEWDYTQTIETDRTVTVEASNAVTKEVYQEIISWTGIDFKEDWMEGITKAEWEKAVDAWEAGKHDKDGVDYQPSGSTGNYNSYVKPLNTSRFFDEVINPEGEVVYVPRYTRDADEMPDWLRTALGSKYKAVTETTEGGETVTKYVPVHTNYWELDTPDAEGTDPSKLKNPHYEQMEGNPDFDFVFARWGEFGGPFDYKILFADGKSQGQIAVGQMRDEFGNLSYGYCMDKDTDSIAGDIYILENLDDTEYFPGTAEEQEAAKEHVRAIALNGYWGTEGGTGSLDQIKKDLEKFINDNPDFSFTYDDPNALIGVLGGTADESTLDTKTFNASADKEHLMKLIDKLNEGGALIVTQSAIWEYGRRDSNPEMAYDSSADADPEFNQALALFRAYLLSEELKDKVKAGLGETEKQETTIIDANTFLVEDGGLSVTIGDKVEDERNEDDNKDNDVYNTDISFTMVVEPGADDDLVISLVSSDGSIVRKARIAGKGDNDEGFDTVEKNGTTYTFTNIALQENSGVTFDLELEGIQHLQEGVYIYKSVLGYDYSQTRVTVGSGVKELDVDTTFTVQFDVDENDKTVVKKSKRTRKVKTYEPVVPPTEPEVPPTDPNVPPTDDDEPNPPSNPPTEIPEEKVPTTDVPFVEIPVEDVPLTEIDGDDVPLVDIVLDEVPLTSAPVSPFMGLSFLSAIGLIFAGRRRKED